MNKATHCRNFVDQAIMYFQIAVDSDNSDKAKEERAQDEAKMKAVYKYLQVTAAKGKRDGRNDRAARKEIEMQNKIVYSSDTALYI